jgi:hypothetical protein
MDALSEVDSALSKQGLRKQVRSALIPGKEFAITYDGPATDKSKVSEIIRPIADEKGVEFSVEVEESVSFP